MYRPFFKPLIDKTIAFFLLLITLPITGIITLLLYFYNHGKPFFFQSRPGLKGKIFRIVKFKTMHDNYDAKGSLLPDTERLTAIGAFVRKTSLDELPQLINVLQGDMSLVGPRPLPVRDFHEFNEDWHRRRFSVRPGITCLWQVNGRSGIPFEKWMELDLEYIDQWSLLLDLKILFKTIPAVIKGSGAA